MTDLYFDKISQLEDTESVLKRCVMAIKCPLKRFYPNKNFGNLIKSSTDIGELLASARYAVRDIDGVYIKSAKAVDDNIQFEIMINDEARVVNINIEKNI